MPDLLLWRINNREKKIWDAKDLEGIDEEFNPKHIMQKHEVNIGKISTTESTSASETARHQEILDCFDDTLHSDDPVKCDILLIEVKGPRDRLDGRQTAWLKALIDFGIPAGVCRIQEPKKVSTKLKSRADVQVLNDDSNTKASGPIDRAVLSKKSGANGIKRKQNRRKQKSSSKKWKKIDRQAISMQDETDFE